MRPMAVAEGVGMSTGVSTRGMDPRADAAWVAGLAGSRAGRLLASHLAAVEVHGSDHDCAMQEALANERVFVHALARSAHNRRPFPCGLPSRLPCFIAVLNLSGERMVVYSDSSALIRSLCAHSTVLHRSELEERLLLFEMHPAKRAADEMRFVLCSYSLPWQAGADAAYWHLSACAINGASDDVERALVDRQPQFSSDSAQPFRGKSALDARDRQLPLFMAAPGVLELVSDKQIAEFVDAYSATCLDKASGPAGVAVAATAAAGGGGGGGANEQIRSLNQRLLQDRDRDQQEIRELKGQVAILKETLGTTVNEALDSEREMEARRLDEVGDAQKKAKELVDHAREQYEALSQEMKGMEATQREVAKEQRRAKKAHEGLITKCEELERKGAAKDALHNAALSQHVATISGLEGKLEKSRAEVRTIRTELEKEHAAVAEREAAQHAEAMSKVVEALESKKRIINQLSVVNEGRDVEVASLKTHEEEQARRIAALETDVADLTSKLAEAAKQGPATKSKQSGPPRRNASTATHHCASTQTDPEEKPLPEPAVGAKVVVEHVPAPAPAPSYQGAIDLLQQLVALSGHEPPPTAAAPVAPMVSPSGYARPLPFPHFTPHHAYQYDPNAHVPSPHHAYTHHQPRFRRSY